LRLSIQLTIAFAVIFALVCFGAAVMSFNAAREMTDAAQAADAKGFGYFWAFLGVVAAGIAALSLWLIRGTK
jgi:hypothetical protein